MTKSIQFRLIVCLIVIGAALFYLYPTYSWYKKPPQERATLEENKDKILGKILNLGLDLRGGIHLVLEVEVDKAPKGTEKSDAIERAREIISNRVNEYGVSEPLIAKRGENEIVVDLPGVKDPDRAIDLIGKTALLEFKLVDDKAKQTDFLDKDGKFDETKIPEGLQALPDKEGKKMIVKKEAELTGSALTNAKVETGEFGMPHVSLEFNAEGAKKFAEVTEANIERNLAIVLDGVVQSAPVIRTKIPDGQAIIEGNFTQEEANNLKIVLRAGALPAPVKIIENRTIGPSLGRDSIRAGVMACIVGLLLVMLLMIIYYEVGGVIANLALLFNLVVLMGAMTMIHATLTLPGIAGIILTLGMAIDANVLIFERTREEIIAGKTIRVALDAGYEKAFVTIIDSQLTTLIAAAFLFQFGEGAIKGFGVTLFIGILISLYTSINVTHLVFDLLFNNRVLKKITIG